MKITGELAIRAKLIWIPAVLFSAFACIFALLRSTDIFTVDGAYRSFEVYRRQSLFFHGNNHMLYPVNVLVWARLAGALGLKPQRPLEFFSTVQLMNCFAGASCLAILCLMMYLATSSWRLALGATVGYGFSNAFIGQATNAAEPLVGVFWSFLALFFAALSFKEKSNWPVVASGLLFSLAMATYQSTILLAPAAIVLIWRSRSQADSPASGSSPRLLAVGAFALSGIFGSLLIYGWAYWLLGMRRPGAMLIHFFTHEDARTYLGVSIGKLLNVPIGLMRNIFHVVPQYIGIRDLLTTRRLAAACLLFLLLLFSAFSAFCAIRVLKRWNCLRPSVRCGLLSAAVGFAFTLIPVVIWEPQYDKLWLQPLACLAFLLAIALNTFTRDTRSPFLVSRGVSIFLLAGVLSNLPWVLRSHRQEPIDMKEAQRVAGMIRTGDLVVGEWESVSALYGSIWGGDEQYFSFPTEAVLYGPDAISRLREVISQANARGGRIYFLTVLDLPKQTWNSFLGSRCGVPYSELDLYRAHSRVCATFRTRSGQTSFETPLRQLIWPISTEP